MSALIEEITVLKAKIASFESERTLLQSLFNIPRSEWALAFQYQFPDYAALRKHLTFINNQLFEKEKQRTILLQQTQQAQQGKYQLIPLNNQLTEIYKLNYNKGCGCYNNTHRALIKFI